MSKPLSNRADEETVLTINTTYPLPPMQIKLYTYNKEIAIRKMGIERVISDLMLLLLNTENASKC